MEVKKRFAVTMCKVAMIEPVGGHGGMDYYDFGLCAGLSDAGCDVTLYTCEKTTAAENAVFSMKHAYQKIYGDFPAWQRGIRYLLGSVNAVLSAVFSGTKICHFHFFHVGVMETFNIALAKLCRRRVVVTAHDVESFVESLSVPRLSLWAYKKADHIIAHNEISKSELIEKLHVAEEKITVIPHGNYLHMLQALPTQAEAKKILGLKDKAKVLLFFGQIKDVKGLDILLKAMPEVLRNHPDTTLLIAGRPWKSDFSEYNELIDKLGIRNNCTLNIRFIPDDEVAQFYAASDLVVLPYRRIYQSGVVLMTMSYGKAVLVSDLPGMTEVVTDEEDGFVFKQGSVDALSTRLIEVLDNETVRNEVASKGKLLMRDHYDWSLIGLKTKAIYQSLLKTKS